MFKGKFSFTPQRTSLSSALVILLVLTIVSRIYLVDGICSLHFRMSFLRVSANLAWSLFQSPWNFFSCAIPAEICFFAFLSVDSSFAQLRRNLKETKRVAYAAGTRKNHRTQWKAYLSFYLYFDLPYLPASLDTVCLYCQLKPLHDSSVGTELS